RCCGPRALHSFPTRRSSDLPSVAGHVPHHLSEHESAQIARTSGRHLVGQYWGRYTAFLSASNRQERIALRDPSGALPLYFFETRSEEHTSELQSRENLVCRL